MTLQSHMKERLTTQPIASITRTHLAHGTPHRAAYFSSASIVPVATEW
jgi:hypothetical protein